MLEWKDGGRQDIVYSKDLVGFGNSYDFNPIVGGFAILIRDGVKYIYTSYPSDYNSHGRAIVTISSEKGVLLRASGSGVADRQGELSQLNSVTYADEVKLSVSGNIIDADANTNVELTFRADAPRMVLSRSKIECTKPTEVKRLYHRLIHADPRKLLRPFSYLYGLGGNVVDANYISENIHTGLFYLSSGGYYVGFFSSRADNKDFFGVGRQRLFLRM